MAIRSKPSSCSGCACENQGTDFSSIEGTGSSGVMLVGEASDEMEARDQLPFRPYAPAGSVLERTFRRMGASREQFSITNILRCRPRNNWLDHAPWEFSAINHCRPNLDSAITERRPRCIVALGGIALRELTGLAGPQQGVGYLAGYVLPGQINTKWPAVAQQKLIELGLADPTDAPIPVIANFHPAYIRRGKASHLGLFARILQRALNIAAGKDHKWIWDIDPENPPSHIYYSNYNTTNGGPSDAQRLNVRPTVAEAESYAHYVLDNRNLILSYDLETSESTSLDEDARDGFVDTNIRLVQFAMHGAGAIAIPWEPEFIPSVREILHSANTKVGWNNWLFDDKVLRAAGQRERLDLQPRGIVHDGLQMYHHWQPDLPAHLQFAAQFISWPFPWKHLAATNIQFYGCCDALATLWLY